MSQDAKPKRVVVIGAGASGIGAARTLSAAGAEVIILEGRDRIGGRMRKHCLTKNLLKSSGLGTNANHFVNIQLGANWIHGMEAATNPMFAVAEALGLELHQTSSDDDPGDDVILFDSGDGDAKTADSDADNVTKNKNGFGRVTKEDYHESLSRYEWIKEYVDHIQFNYEKEDISLQAAFDLALQASESEIFGPCSAPQRRCLNWLYDRVSIDLGAHISQVSLNCYAEGVSDGQGGEALVKHIGYSGILDHLATEFPLDIRLGRHVASIALQTTTELDSSCEQKLPQHHDLDPDRDRAQLQLQQCALKDGRYVRITCTGGETFLADACVVTVPVGALQAGSIAFSPRAPSVITSVCASLKLGLMNLVWLWYPEVFWPEECNFLGVAREAGGAGGAEDLHNHPSEHVVKFSTFLVPPVFDNLGVRQPVLMCQIVGPYATTIESMTDADIAAEATSVLRAMFGAQQVPDAIGCAHSSWGSDPFARGSWSYFPYRTAPTGGGDGSGSVVASAAVASVAAAGAGLSALSITSDSDSLQVAGVESAPASTVSASTVSLVEGGGAGCSVSGKSHPATTDTTVLRPSSSFPLRSVTISEAASMLSPRIRSAHSTVQVSAATGGGDGVYHRARRYSSDFGFTSDGSQDSDSEGCESTDSSDNDDDEEEEEEAGVLAGRANTYASTTTTPATAYGSVNTSSSPCTGSSSGTSSSSSSDEGVLTSVHQRARTDDELLSAHICYASEAMSVLNRGTVHGAYMSGIREATKILAFLEDRK